MKRILGLALALVFLSVPAFAAKNSQSVLLAQAATVGSTQLPAGHYRVTWTGSGSTVQVTLKQEDVHAPAIATVPAKLVTEKHDRASVLTGAQGGTNTIEQIQLSHVSLVLSSRLNSGQ
jgi:hypothetical protein